jgi:hypothetical protein
MSTTATVRKNKFKQHQTKNKTKKKQSSQKGSIWKLPLGALTLGEEEPRAALGVKGINGDPSLDDLQGQDASRFDETVFAIDRLRCVTRTELNSNVDIPVGNPPLADASGGSLRMVWRVPFPFADTATGNPSMDSRGVLTGVSHATITVTNLTATPLIVKMNSPLSSSLAPDRGKIVSRMNDIDAYVGPAGSGKQPTVSSTTRWNEASGLVCPHITTCQLSTSSTNKEPMLTLFDLAIVVPDYLVAGEDWSSDMEVVSVKLRVYYTAESVVPPGVNYQTKSSKFVVFNQKLLDMYRFNAIVRPTTRGDMDFLRDGLDAKVTFGEVTMDSYDLADSVGYQWVDQDGTPIEAKTPSEQKADYKLAVRLVYRVGDSYHPLRLRAYEEDGFALQTMFGPVYGLGGYSVHDAYYANVASVWAYSSQKGAWVAADFAGGGEMSFKSWPYYQAEVTTWPRSSPLKVFSHRRNKREAGSERRVGRMLFAPDYTASFVITDIIALLSAVMKIIEVFAGVSGGSNMRPKK